MKLTAFASLVAALSIALVCRVSLGAQQSGGQSVWDGVYTDEQAQKGLIVYTETCASCHGGELEGDGFAPALTGPEFMSTWNGTTVGDLFERIRVSMPPGTPESVSAQDKTTVVAFVLQRNKFPAGQTALPPQAEAMKAIKFEANKPGRD
jgi:S-disulfanyl-L-cysteine oxidoreductase SoxD